MKVAIAGFGLEGMSNFNYWSKLGADITIFDEKQPTQKVPAGVSIVVGQDTFTKINGFDLVIRTAGLRPDKIKTDDRVWSSTNEFFEKCPAPIIGVTGTKGKGTTASLIAQMLSNDEKNVHLLGNIGVPALDILPTIKPDDIVVFELSSFQLWDLTRSPETAVVLMIEPEHQDVHSSMEEYVNAKSNIAKFQTEDDLIIYHPNNPFSAKVAENSKARKMQYMKPSGAYVIGGQIVIGDIAVALSQEVGLIGEHNLENICAAITAAWRYTKNITAIQSAIKTFKGLPNRLEFVKEVRGVKFYNDSYSSAPGATIAAIKSFSEPEVLICGGFDRGLDYSELALSISLQKNIKKVLLMGQTKTSIADHLAKVGFLNFELLDGNDFKGFIQIAKDAAEPGDIVVLSPGCASFDMFKDFNDRGNQFKKIVEEL